MVQALISVKAEKEQRPAAPLEDEAVIQHLMEVLLVDMFESPHIEIQKEILLGSVRDGRLRVVTPLQVKLNYEGRHTIAEAVELDEFGFGDNVSEAIADLQRTITELYFTLEKEQKRLGTDLQRIWNILQEKILKR